MKIAVVGAGAIGGYYGALLQDAGCEVTFLARGEHLRALREQGLRLEDVGSPARVLPVRAVDRADAIGPVDLVLFAVKSYDTEAAAAHLPPLLGPHTAVLTLQNGVANVEVLAERVGREHVLGGACYIFTSVPAPGVIRRTGGPRRIVFGELDGSRSPRARAIEQALAATGVPVELSDRILVELWEKYLFITAQGGMTALTRLPVGVLRSTPATFEMYLDVASEVAAVGRAHGVPIPPGERDRVRRFADALDPDSYSSLYTDLTRGRRLELDALVGYAVRLGQRYGIPTPMCRAIYAALLPYDEVARRTAAPGQPEG
ncbi:MAG: 2-dehydropantoate 2-reductase [Armatimonadota bacterium]|nr:2-dehydropantoate 2-reductase [Armatimonadota bacterium]MDR7402878.1 2-dehydropantoate 2-reductase [Armatimonadota bacterium]MDR7404394.1 2-dehydropantoate 2-reductase [Armatimonadota bacterium]MDR7438178.1 2-dehydropantoate 2-reductase [Armatimonadota bacterium]MDR7472208.1 2-dehydropantoate 2-reductase [Armatimonadota bacterium]